MSDIESEYFTTSEYNEFINAIIEKVKKLVNQSNKFVFKYDFDLNNKNFTRIRIKSGAR